MPRLGIRIDATVLFPSPGVWLLSPVREKSHTFFSLLQHQYAGALAQLSLVAISRLLGVSLLPLSSHPLSLSVDGFGICYIKKIGSIKVIPTFSLPPKNLATVSSFFILFSPNTMKSATLCSISV